MRSWASVAHTCELQVRARAMMHRPGTGTRWAQARWKAAPPPVLLLPSSPLATPQAALPTRFGGCVQHTYVRDSSRYKRRHRQHLGLEHPIMLPVRAGILCTQKQKRGLQPCAQRPKQVQNSQFLTNTKNAVKHHVRSKQAQSKANTNGICNLAPDVSRQTKMRVKDGGGTCSRDRCARG